MEKFELTILGCGSALPTLRHNGSAQVLNVRNKYFLIDCAEGTQVELRRHRIHLNRLNTIFLSHLHGDHCFGLMGLVSTLGLLGRTAPLHVYAPDGAENVFRSQLDFFCNGMPYEVVFHSVDTHQVQVIYEDRTLTVTSLPLRHRIRCCGFLFQEKPLAPHIRRDMIDYYQIPVSQINNIKAGMDYQCPDGTIVPHERLTFPAAPPRSYAYCSDTMFRPELSSVLEGVDLLYHEATFAEADAALCARVYHSTARQAAELAKLSNAKDLLIGHFSSRYENEQVLLDEARTVFPSTRLAGEGMVVPITGKSN